MNPTFVLNVQFNYFLIFVKKEVKLKELYKTAPIKITA
jgi:hypothetical protein